MYSKNKDQKFERLIMDRTNPERGAGWWPGYAGEKP